MNIMNIATPPPWPYLVLLGGFTGLIFRVGPAFIQNTVVFIWRYFKVKPPVLGTWHSYHCTYRKDQPMEIKSTIEVRRGFRTQFVAILRQEDTSNLSYKGTVVREKNHLVFSFGSVNHAENVVARFPEPLGGNWDNLYGIWLAYDHDQHVSSGGILLTKAPINNSSLIEEISKGYDLPRGRPQLRVSNSKKKIKSTKTAEAQQN